MKGWARTAVTLTILLGAFGLGRASSALIGFREELTVRLRAPAQSQGCNFEYGLVRTALQRTSFADGSEKLACGERANVHGVTFGCECG